ncbi:MAG: hypothetical protein H7210_00465 [Pyrinomonadaceae bacterium]|nr:hypothetical protein [Phycisphaerales bacterium]
MLELPRRRLLGRRPLRLEAGAYGKHPAWADHIDDGQLMATPTSELRAIASWLTTTTYAEFIKQNPLQGLPPDDLAPLDHLIVRRTNSGSALALVWSSTDYTDREYPMVVAVDCEGLGVGAALREVLPGLRKVRERVRRLASELRARIEREDPGLAKRVDTTAARNDVRAAVLELRTALASLGTPVENKSDLNSLLTGLRAHPDSGPDGLGLARVYHRLMDLKTTTSGQFRLPRSGEDDQTCVRRWLAFLGFFAHHSNTYTLAIPQRVPRTPQPEWIDLFVGEVGTIELTRLRWNENREKAENRISYAEVDQAYAATCGRMMDEWIGANTPSPPATPPPPPSSSIDPPAAAPAPAPSVLPPSLPETTSSSAVLPPPPSLPSCSPSPEAAVAPAPPQRDAATSSELKSDTSRVDPVHQVVHQVVQQPTVALNQTERPPSTVEAKRRLRPRHLREWGLGGMGAAAALALGVLIFLGEGTDPDELRSGETSLVHDVPRPIDPHPQTSASELQEARVTATTKQPDEFQSRPPDSIEQHTGTFTTVPMPTPTVQEYRQQIVDLTRSMDALESTFGKQTGPGAEPVRALVTALNAATDGNDISKMIAEAQVGVSELTATAEKSWDEWMSQMARTRFDLRPLDQGWDRALAAVRGGQQPRVPQREHLEEIHSVLAEIQAALQYQTSVNDADTCESAARFAWLNAAEDQARRLTADGTMESSTPLPSRDQIAGARQQISEDFRNARLHAAALTSLGAQLRSGMSVRELEKGAAVQLQISSEAPWDEMVRACAGSEGRIVELARLLLLQKQPAALLDSVSKAGPGELGLARTAWDQIMELAPNLSTAELQRIADQHSAMEAAILMSSVEERDARLAQLRQRTGQIAINRLFAGPSDDALLMAGASVLSAAHIGRLDERLPRVIRFNLALASLKKELLASKLHPSSDLTHFIACVEELLQLAQGAEQSESLGRALASMTIDVEAPRQPPTMPTVQISESLAGAGPGAAGWTLRIGQEDRAVYEGPDALTLDFRRLPGIAGPEQPAVFLCTQEVSVGLLVSMFKRKPQDFQRWLPVEGGSDQRAGVRTWGFDPSVPERLTAALYRGHPDERAWFPIRKMGSYPTGLTIDPPSLRSPAQYLSAAASALLAASLGCRLPTASEWLIAATTARSTSLWNRRDKTWLLQQQCVARGECKGPRPNAECISPPGSAQITDDEPAVEYNDGTLWFSPVDAGPAAPEDGPFLHLFGNVAEWTFEDSAALERITRSGDFSTLDTLVLDKNSWRVIGASALSARGFDPVTAYRVDFSAADRRGFADVGMRLAFSVPLGNHMSTTQSVLQADMNARRSAQLELARQLLLAIPYH